MDSGCRYGASARRMQRFEFTAVDSGTLGKASSRTTSMTVLDSFLAVSAERQFEKLSADQVFQLQYRSIFRLESVP